MCVLNLQVVTRDEEPLVNRGINRSIGLRRSLRGKKKKKKISQHEGAYFLYVSLRQGHQQSRSYKGNLRQQC